MEYGCIGEHLPHSFSKEIHEKIGDYPYILRELRPEDVGPFLEAKEFRAINVTIPYKQTVIPYLYEMDENARAIGAVNTVVNRNGRLYGYNTDFYGMNALIRREKIQIAGQKVLILGTGGTSRTAFAVAEHLGARAVYKVSRTARKDAVTYAQALQDHADAGIIINTTPVGMYPHPDASPIDPAAFHHLEAVLDAVYNPLRTKLILSAREQGVRAQTGLYMLVSQAVRAYEIFMDTAAPADISEAIFQDIYASKQNIVLIGMPGSGKSSVGKRLAEMTGRPFFDTDERIRETAGAEIAEIIRTEGEAFFRELETKAVKSIAEKTGCVIATGGGAVLKPENTEYLKMNGRLYFLDRDPDLLIPTPDRPLSSTKEAVLQRYKERYPVYTAAADDRIPGNDEIESVANAIERRHFS